MIEILTLIAAGFVIGNGFAEHFGIAAKEKKIISGATAELLGRLEATSNALLAEKKKNEKLEQTITQLTNDYD